MVRVKKTQKYENYAFSVPSNVRVNTVYMHQKSLHYYSN